MPTALKKAVDFLIRLKNFQKSESIWAFRKMKKDGNGIRHIAFIMDGNGRWAKKRLMPREYGHSAGAKKFREIIRHCSERGIDCVTVYAFSTENWKRPKKEVDTIMKLFQDYIKEAERVLRKTTCAYCLSATGTYLTIA